MAVPIIVSNSNNILTNTVSSVNWIINPPRLKFYWIMGTPLTSGFNVKVTFPNYSLISTFAGFTDWNFEADLDHNSFYVYPSPSIPFSKVEGVQSYSGSLGVMSGTLYEKTLNYTFFNFNLLSAGQYLVTCKYKITAVNPVSGFRETISSKEQIIDLVVSAYFSGLSAFDIFYPGYQIVLSGPDINLEQKMTFNYHAGGALPPAQELFQFYNVGYVTEVLFVSAAAVLSTDVIIHPNFKKSLISLSSSISSLPQGVYNYSLKVGYPASVFFGSVFIEVPITLNVLPAIVGNISATPNDLAFEVIVGGSVPEDQSISLTSTNSWQVTSQLPTWLSISQYQGTGNTTILFSVINYNDLTSGVYNFDVTFTNSDGFNVSVSVELILTVFVANPFINGRLNFSKELDFLRFETQNFNTYVAISLEIKTYELENYNEVIYLRNYNLPLSNKKGEFHVGSIVDQLFDEMIELEQVVENQVMNFSINNYKPAKVKISYQEVAYSTPIIPITLSEGEIDGVLFIRGKKPFVTDSQLCLLTVQQQNLTRITKNSAIAISFTHLGIPSIVVKRNNIVIEQFSIPSFSSDPKIIYSYFRFTNSFSTGDLIEIIVISESECRVHRYLVHPTGLDSTIVLFENSNGVVEPFELTGRRRQIVNKKHTTTSRIKNLEQRFEKVKSVKSPTLTINSGAINSGDYRILDEISSSEKVWISTNGINGDYFQVDCTSQKITEFDSQNTENTFDLDFNIL